jgi:peptidoglycan/xylan/chitin deacetylase (PgdA/CDA1 family)
VTGKRRNKRDQFKQPGIWVLMLLALLTFAAGYSFTACGLSERAVSTFQLWFGGEKPAVSLPDNGEDPQPEPDPGLEQPDQQPGEVDDQPAGDPVIYVGQVLTIPAPEGGGGGAVSQSRVVQSGTLPSANKQIALTFDSGWETRQTIPMLDILDQYSVNATFFPRALWVQDNPDLAREIVKRGHTMGNHSLTHPRMREMTAEQIRHEMKESTRVIQEVTAVKPYLFRPPYGEYNQRVLEVLGEAGYPYTVMWTVDTIDWAAGTTLNVGGSQVYIDTDFIVNRALNNASNNGIVLMHIMDRSDTVEALPRIIEGLREMGYEFVTVDSMLPAPGSGTVTHTVKEGDTLYSIAQK